MPHKLSKVEIFRSVWVLSTAALSLQIREQYLKNEQLNNRQETYAAIR
jgi:hypothetical protein